MSQKQCYYCLGSGRMPRDPDIGTDQECFVCDGSGIVESTHSPDPDDQQTGDASDGCGESPDGSDE